MKIVPELYCSNIEVTRRFYIDVLQMNVKYEREEDFFIYFSRDGIDIMVEQLEGEGRRWLTAELEKPFGRGVNFQWDIEELKIFYKHVKKSSHDSIFLELENKEYRCGKNTVRQDQFIIRDPDGYLFRFCSET